MKKQLTAKQIKALEMFITLSPDCTSPAKKALIWFIRQSEKLTRPTQLRFAKEVGHVVQQGVHDMNSTGHKTHLPVFLRGMGTEAYIDAFGEERTGDVIVRVCPNGLKDHFSNRFVTLAPDMEVINSLSLPTWECLK